MPILPVLDLKQGQIVRGVGGRRAEYRPIVSKLVDSAVPLAVARAFQAHFGFRAFYLADLDAIQHGQPALDVYASLHDAGFRLWIDAGLRDSRDDTLAALIEADTAGIVVGLESVEGPLELHEIVERAGNGRAIFSLDLNAGQPIGQLDAWQISDAWPIAERAVTELGVRRLIVLDLACVGTGAGVGAVDLCARLKRAFPELQLTTGGGVRGMDDVRRLEGIGVDFVLVASALHDGRIESSAPEV